MVTHSFPFSSLCHFSFVLFAILYAMNLFSYFCFQLRKIILHCSYVLLFLCPLRICSLLFALPNYIMLGHPGSQRPSQFRRHSV